MTAAFNLSQLANNLNTSGQLDATDGLSGLIANANLASSGTASSSTFLRGDRTWGTPVGGKVLNVWTDTLLTGESLSCNNAETNPSVAWTESSLDITVTPTYSNSRFLVFADVKYSGTFNIAYRVRDVTESVTLSGSTNGNRIANTGGPSGSTGTPSGGNSYGTDSRTSVIYYTPATSQSSRRFRIDFVGLNGTGTAYVGRVVTDSNNAYSSYSPCSLTIIEVAA